MVWSILIKEASSRRSSLVFFFQVLVECLEISVLSGLLSVPISPVAESARAQVSKLSMIIDEQSSAPGGLALKPRNYEVDIASSSPPECDFSPCAGNCLQETPQIRTVCRHNTTRFDERRTC